MTGRAKAIAFYITLGSVLVAITIFLNVGWIMTHYRRVGALVLGIVSFAIIISGIVIYTIFLVLEIRKNEQHDSFINAVTHELKTPIASIRLYLQTLQSRQVPDAQREHFYRVMLDDSERLIYTVEQVLKAGAAKSKRDRMEFQPVPITELVNDCAEIVRLRYHLQPEELAIENRANGINVLGDPDDLRTAVNNLLDNAVKYSPEVRRVAIELESDHEHLRLQVRDRGIGIPHNQLKKIFARFYRVPGVRNVQGTGLGLYIVHSIVKRHGGTVYAESPGEGKGSSFTIELPRLLG
ncbi:MAG TPA: HAMP domain-containing sensor histidine kinase [Terriglobales bacterium]|jgi:two-component system, OmpR family, sensor histidine kinase SenX3|nr:HAMP domain-containing sensor histidine kinase [Terriglobales bacterium]